MTFKRLLKLFNFNIFIIAGFWILGLISTTKIPPAIFPDSGGYLLGTSENAWGNFSVTGESVRAWPTQFIFALASENDGRVFIQTLLYLSSVTFFLYATSQFRKERTSYFSTILICALFLSDNVFQWNFAILSESTTLSLYLAGISFLILSLKYKRFQLLFFSLALFFMMLGCLVRLQLLVPTIAISIFVFMLNRQVKFIAPGFILLACIVSYSLYVNSNISEVWGGGQGQTSKNTTSYYFLTATETKNDALSDRLFENIPKSAPSCLKTNSSRAPFVESPGPYVFQAQQYQRCLNGVLWLNENFIPFYLKFLITNPIYVVETAWTYLPESISDVKYAAYKGYIPTWIQDMWTTNANYVVNSLPFYIWILFPVLALVLKRKNLFKVQTLALVVIWLGLFVSLLSTYLFMNAELARIAVSSVYPLISISIILSLQFFSREETSIVLKK
jgi:hypothetical protein